MKSFETLRLARPSNNLDNVDRRACQPIRSKRPWQRKGPMLLPLFGVRHRQQAHQTILYTQLDSLIMSVAPSSAALRCCRHALKLRSSQASSQCTRLASTCTSITPDQHRRRMNAQVPGRRWQSTDAVAVSPKISGIVDQISQLTLLETADLVQSLKVRTHLSTS